MKRYVRGFVAIIATLAFMGGVASAEDTPACSGATITNTGPGSENEIVCVDATDIKVSCVNNVYVVTDNSQTAGSGDATTGHNTSGGSSITGNATNENGTNVEIGASCGSQPAPVVTPTTSTPTTPAAPQPVGGMGAVAPAPTPGMGIATLPNTSSNPLLDNALVAGTSLTTLLVATRLGMIAYRRFALK